MREEDISTGWQQASHNISLEEINSSVRIPQNAGLWRKLFTFMGPGALVAVGYVDPGNWATSLAGGARYGYTLLSVILISNLVAILLQEMSARLGIATDTDLAQAIRNSTGKKTSFCLWILTELAIIATDIAEVIGSAIALNLLFGIPLLVGVAITTIDVLILLLLQKKGFRLIESIIIILVAMIFFIFLYEVFLSQPSLVALVKGYIPSPQIVMDPGMLFISLSILGATVMPHNLYLHSALVQTRQYERNLAGRKEAIKFARIDSFFSLNIAFFINSLILILGSATFHGGTNVIEEIQDAYEFLTPILGVTVASTLFAIALLASGQSSTITGTITGQIIMEGFIHLKIKPWMRRLITRLLAVIPVFFVTWLIGESGTGILLLWSQVVLSLQLPFAVVPLLLYTSDKRKMGIFVNSQSTKITAWISVTIIIALNIFLVSYIIMTGKELG